jgi:hypothetical protein
MNRPNTVARTADFDLAARDNPVAKDTDPLVVERSPFPPGIGRAQSGEFLFWKERWFDHWKGMAAIKSGRSVAGNPKGR